MYLWGLDLSGTPRGAGGVGTVGGVGGLLSILDITPKIRYLPNHNDNGNVNGSINSMKPKRSYGDIYSLADSLKPLLIAGGVEDAIQKVETLIHDSEAPPICKAWCELDFLDPPESVANSIEQFIVRSNRLLGVPIRTVFLHLTMPSLIPYLSFCYFGYIRNISNDLSELEIWDVDGTDFEDLPRFRPIGFEKLAEFSWFNPEDANTKEVEVGDDEVLSLFDLLIMYKFQRLAWKAAGFIGGHDVNLMASAEGYSECYVWRMKRC